jgi:hypothetical protein
VIDTGHVPRRYGSRGACERFTDNGERHQRTEVRDTPPEAQEARPRTLRRRAGSRDRRARQPRQSIFASEIATVTSPSGVVVRWKMKCMLKLSPSA